MKICGHCRRYIAGKCQKGHYRRVTTTERTVTHAHRSMLCQDPPKQIRIRAEMEYTSDASNCIDYEGRE